MDFETITYRVDDSIATITLNRPDAYNGFTEQMADELASALVTADEADDVRVVVLAAVGRHFCVGADLNGFGVGAVNDPEWIEPATRVARPMAALNKPVIAAMQGAAVGVGITMTLSADFRLAATTSRFGFVFGRRGLFPEGGSMWFLPRIVGLAKAKEWMLTGRVFGADTALAAGLVTSVHEPEDLLAAAYSLARELATDLAPISLAAIRRGLLAMSGADSPEPAFELDRKLIGWSTTSADLAEGVGSFLEKRQAKFTGSVNADLPQLSSWLDG